MACQYERIQTLSLRHIGAFSGCIADGDGTAGALHGGGNE